MLFTPSTDVLGTHLTTRFVVVTRAAHLIFGVVMGFAVRALAQRWGGLAMTKPALA